MHILKKTCGFFSMLGIIVFTTIVIFLQMHQENYLWYEQLMSELALGKSGWLMRFAFFSIGLSCIGLLCTAKTIQVFTLVVTAISFSLAGIFELGKHDFLHIGLIFIAFMSATLSILIAYQQSHSLVIRFLCGSALILALVAILLSNMNVIPLGLAQRLAAFGILGWIFLRGMIAVFSDI